MHDTVIPEKQLGRVASRIRHAVLLLLGPVLIASGSAWL